MTHVHVLGEQVRGCLKMGAHPQLTGDLAADGHIVTGDHLDLETMLLGTPDGLFGVIPGRVLHRQDAEEVPTLAVIRRLRDTQGALALRGKVGNRLFGPGPGFTVE